MLSNLIIKTIFPTFLLCAGFSASLSQPPLLKLCRRTILLSGLGLVYNSAAAILANRPVRFPGVLQRIALSSFVNSIQPFRIWFFPFVATAAWWWISVNYYNCETPDQGEWSWWQPPHCTAQTRIDWSVFRKVHMYSPDYDPEGLLSTLTTAAVTVTAGTVVISSSDFQAR